MSPLVRIVPEDPLERLLLLILFLLGFAIILEGRD